MSKKINYESLTNEELVELIQKNNDPIAKEVLVDKNNKFIHSFVRRYCKYEGNVEYHELYQEGVIGLLKSAYRYKPELGFKFVTYAGNFIFGQIKWALRESSDHKAFRIGREWKYLYNKMNRAKDELRQKLMKEPNTKELAEYMGETEENICRCITLNEGHTSIHLTKYIDQKCGDNLTIEDGLVDESYNEDLEIEKIILKENIKKLPQKEQFVLKQKYFNGKTQREISEMMGTSQAQVSRREKRALKLLKELYRKEI